MHAWTRLTRCRRCESVQGGIHQGPARERSLFQGDRVSWAGAGWAPVGGCAVGLLIAQSAHRSRAGLPETSALVITMAKGRCCSSCTVLACCETTAICIKTCPKRALAASRRWLTCWLFARVSGLTRQRLCACLRLPAPAPSAVCNFPIRRLMSAASAKPLHRNMGCLCTLPSPRQLATFFQHCSSSHRKQAACAQTNTRPSPLAGKRRSLCWRVRRWVSCTRLPRLCSTPSSPGLLRCLSPSVTYTSLGHVVHFYRQDA